MRGSAVFLALAVCIFSVLISPSALAQTGTYEGQKLLPDNYIAPRYACNSDNGQECVLVAYDNSSNAVKIFVTFSRFANDTYPLAVNRTLVTDSKIWELISQNTASAIPYDVVYVPDGYRWSFTPLHSEFAITYGNQIYGINVTADSFGTINSTNRSEFSGDVWWFIDHNTDSSKPHFISINTTSGKTDWFIEDNDNRDEDGSSTFKNWVSADYVGGMILASDESTDDYNQSYILFPYDSIGVTTGYSNTTDDELSVTYEGIFHDTEELGSLEVFGRNSTDVFRYDLLGGTPESYFVMSSNNIISQSAHINPSYIADLSFVFQNSSGLYLYNAFTRAFIGYPDEYNLSLNTFVYGGLFRDPHKPKIDCSNDMSQCTMLIYDAGVFTKGVHMLLSIDANHEVWTEKYTFSVNLDGLLTGHHSESQLPYDIIYHESTGKYRIIITDRRYEWDGSAVPSDVTPTCDCEGSCDVIDCYHLQFADETGDAVITRFDWRVSHWCDALRTSRLAVMNWSDGDYDNRLYGLDLCADMGCIGYLGYCNSYILGWFHWDGSQLEYEYTATCSPWNKGACASDPATFKQKSTLHMTDEHTYTDPIQYYYDDEGFAFFERDAGDTPSYYGHGMYYAGNIPVHGIDWLYPAVSPYYIYDATQGEETYTHSRKSPDTGTKYYATSIKKGWFVFWTNNVYYFERPFYNTYVIPEYYDVPYLLYRPANVTAILTCTDGSGYTTSGYGDYITLSHPCLDYNIVTETLTYRPYYYSFTTELDDPTCNYNFIKLRYLKSHQFAIHVVDDVTLNDIQNARVELNGEVKYTDVNGYVYYNVFPLESPTMTNLTAPTCQELYVASATTLRSFSAEVFKIGYQPYSEFDFTNAIAEISGDTIIYHLEKQINLLPEGATLTVRLIDRNGNDLYNPELNSQTTVTGSQTVYVINIVTGEPYLQDTASGVPAQFYLGDNRTTFNVTVNFTYMNFNDSQVVEMERDGIELVTFRLNQSRTEMSCTDNLDCPTNFCDGSYFYKLEGCITGICSYKQPEFCSVGCDVTYGCYDAHTTVECETRFDCNNSCITDWRSATGLCGADGYCIKIYTSCEGECPSPHTGMGCNNDTGLCCDREQCWEEGRERYRFYLWYEYVDVDHLIPTVPNPFVPVMDYDFYCGVENMGDRVCINGATIPKTITGAWRESETFVTSDPDNWKWEYDDELNYEFYDIAVECGVNCELTYDYCEHGCNRETFYCQHAPIEDANFTEQYDINIYQPISIVEDSINKTQLRASGLGFLLLLVTPIFIITGIALLIGTIIGWKTKEPLLGTVGFVGILTVFSLLQLFPIWLVLILALIAGMVFSKMILGLVKGG